MNISELTIMKSAAGYYIGRWCDDGPYSRESGYFNDRTSAEEHLSNMNSTHK